MSVCLAVATLQYGGVDAAQWQYLAAIIALTTLGCAALRSRRPRTTAPIDLWLVGAVAAWMLLALVPLPPGLVQLLSPYRANLALQAHILTGANTEAWLPLSVAPAATFERLLFVLPALATFVAAREMPLWWPGQRAWLAVAPVIGVATIEAIIGVAQINSAVEAGGLRAVSGTYVNRNHYAGLLEMGLPLALTCALALWSRSGGFVHSHRHRQRRESPGVGKALLTGGLLLVTACLLAGVVTSLSRMGFLTTLAALTTVSVGWLVARRQRGRTSRWLWLVPVLLPIALVTLVATNGIVLRFAEPSSTGDITTDGRLQIWRETMRLFAAYPLTGSGLGTFEHALYPFRTALPTMAVDYAHNDYLQIACETGGIGIALAMMLAGVVAWRVASAAFRSPRHAWLGMGLLASLLALALHSLVDFNLYVPANALAAAWLAGVAVSPELTGAES